MKKEKIIIREIQSDELHCLEDMMYESIYQPDETNLIPRDVLNLPAIRVYIDNFGRKKGDYCLVADINRKIVGAVWTRILSGDIKGFGNVDSETPEFAISLYKEYRNQGIGTRLMSLMIEHLQKNGYRQTSLSVQKENYAVQLYKNLGFEIIGENDDDYIMLIKLE